MLCYVVLLLVRMGQREDGRGTRSVIMEREGCLSIGSSVSM